MFAFVFAIVRLAMVRQAPSVEPLAPAA